MLSIFSKSQCYETRNKLQGKKTSKKEEEEEEECVDAKLYAMKKSMDH